MRGEILSLLREGGGFVSGEEISQRFAVSRTAIWKHMRELKELGYEIEAHPRRGYRLLRAPDRLLPDEVRHGLQTKWLGKRVEYIPVTESTNTVAKKLAAAGCESGTIVLSEEQSGGKGRLTRSWFSPPGQGLWLSIVLRPPMYPQEAPKFTLLAAVAAAEAIRVVTGVQVGIKWPNDILLQGRKAVGILTEMNAEMDGINYIVVGMGINVNIPQTNFPQELQEIATSLQMETGQPVNRLLLLQRLLLEFEALYEQALREGFAPILDRWRGWSVTLGQLVDVIGPDRRFSGQARDIDPDGALLVDADGKIERVLAGDVSIRPRT